MELDAHGDLVTSFKKSKAGRLKLVKTLESYTTVRTEESHDAEDQLVTVFENGHLVNESTFEQVRERAAQRSEMSYV